jgi:cytochrome c peroxidase
MLVRPLAALALSLVLAAAAPQEKEPRDLPAFLGPLRKVFPPDDNPTTEAKVELGRRLFYDPRLSGNGAIACATCHNPAFGFTDGLAKGVGFNGVILGRSSPTVLNAAYHEEQFWDGRAPSLEEQAKGPIQADKEMNNTAAKAVATLQAIPGYVKLFQEAFGGEPTFDRVAMAIASFERTVVDLDSPFDRWARGDEAAMSDAQKRGFDLFVGRARCSVCHSGPLFADKRYHNIGLEDGDPGRAAVTKEEKDKGAFKTASVRNAAITGPYMHNGQLKTLREVIDHYEKVTNEREKHPNLSIFALQFKLEEAEKKDLEAFLHALTGDKRDPRINVVPVLPQ